MASCSWKIVPDTAASNIQYQSFLSCRKFFAADNSGSTAGAVCTQQRAFIDYLRTKTYKHKKDAISLWGSSVHEPTKDFDSVAWTCNEGTYPSEILKLSSAVRHIRKSDVWFLLTDGEVYDGEVHELAEKAFELHVLNVPIVFVIVGSRGWRPDTTNISVGVSFFAGAQDTAILFKETQTGKVYVIAAKGCFAPLGGSATAQDLSSWTDLPNFENEEAFFGHCKSLDIKVPQAKSRPKSPKGVSLGPEWDKAHGKSVWVDLDRVLEAGSLSDEDAVRLFSEEAFSNLSVAYKTRRRMPELRSFVQDQKVDQVTPKFEDFFDAAAIIRKMGEATITEEERKVLQGELRETHAKNREHYQKLLSDFSTSSKQQNIRKRNQLVDAALRALASIEAAGFNAEILARRSNRARRANVVTSDNAVDMANLDLNGPACRGYCLVCCGDDEIMSICLKELDDEHVDDNTTDFALNFPLAAGASDKNVNMMSSQNVCFQCALLGPDGMSIYKEPLKAIIPAVQYEGANKKYIQDQLYRALTAGLVTGAAGIAQLFMAILDQVLRTKSWAGAGVVEPANSTDEEFNEAGQRKRTFQWMLDQLVQNTRTRETFTEVGEWVKFPQALEWVAKDFAANGLASFAVTYPVAGFGKLVSMGKMTGAFDEETVRRLATARGVYSVAAKYLADLQKAVKDGDNSKLWRQKYLEAIYKEFNAPLIPRDLGQNSLLTDLDAFQTHLNTFLTPSDIDTDVTEPLSTLTLQDSDSTSTTPSPHRLTTMHKAQALLFWLLHTQSSPCTAQTFFTTLRQTQHLALPVLDPSLTLPVSELTTLLLSPFPRTSAIPIDPAAFASHTSPGPIPFASPFGASVLHCGVATCNHPFVDLNTLSTTTPPSVAVLDRIRTARASHLIRVFGLRGHFEISQTGLPDRCVHGALPSSNHVSLHASVVRAWADQEISTRRGILDAAREGGAALDAFVDAVREKIFEVGRGNLYRDGLERDVRAVLPSFFDVLQRAVDLETRGDDGVEGYTHDFENENSLAAKVRFEMRVLRAQR